MSDTPDYVNGEPEPIHNFNPSVHDLLVNDAKHKVMGFARPGMTDIIKEQMIDLFRTRKAYGLNKYGTVLQSENGRDFLKDAIEETIDQLAYVRQGLEENTGDENLKEAYRLAVAALDGMLRFKMKRELAEQKKNPARKFREDQGQRLSDVTIVHNANGPRQWRGIGIPMPEGKKLCYCESGVECGGTGFKDA